MPKAFISLLLFLVLAGGAFVYWRMGGTDSPATSLNKAAARGDTAAVEKLLKAGTDVNARPPGAAPALVTAAAKGKTDTARLLIQKGANLDARNEALAIAVKQCDLPTVQLLLSGGADGKTLLKADTTGKSPFAQAKEQVGVGPSPCADVIRALELAGITDKPRPRRKP